MKACGNYHYSRLEEKKQEGDAKNLDDISDCSKEGVDDLMDCEEGIPSFTPLPTLVELELSKSIDDEDTAKSEKDEEATTTRGHKKRGRRNRGGGGDLTSIGDELNEEIPEVPLTRDRSNSGGKRF